MIPTPERRWFRLSLRTLIAVLTVFLFWLRWQLALFSVAWGIMQGCGMWVGIRLAGPQAWERKPNRLRDVLVMGVILGMLCLPAVYGFASGGIGVGMAQIAVIVVGLTFSLNACTWWFGPIEKLNQAENSAMPEGPCDLAGMSEEPMKPAWARARAILNRPLTGALAVGSIISICLLWSVTDSLWELVIPVIALIAYSIARILADDPRP